MCGWSVPLIRTLWLCGPLFRHSPGRGGRAARCVTARLVACSRARLSPTRAFSRHPPCRRAGPPTVSVRACLRLASSFATHTGCGDRSGPGVGLLPLRRSAPRPPSCAGFRLSRVCVPLCCSPGRSVAALAVMAGRGRSRRAAFAASWAGVTGWEPGTGGRSAPTRIQRS